MDTAQKTEEAWKQELTPEQYRVLRQKGTEAPFTGKYTYSHEDGIYRCAGCGAELFRSDDKFDSSCGWPSFTTPAGEDTVNYHEDHSYGMERVEVTCKRCGGHLGHVFDDGPGPNGLRYCINSVSLDLEKTGR